MGGILENITLILEFILNAFTRVFEFINTNPIIGISVYLPLAFFLIISVFRLVSSLFKKRD